MSHWAGPAPGAGFEVSLLTWNFEPGVVAPVLVSAALYVRGWRIASRRMPDRFDRRHLVAMTAGLFTIVLALASPLDALSARLLHAHMTQHLLLMVVAPPLLWMGKPVAPLLLGLAPPARRTVVGALSVSEVRRLTLVLADPIVSWAAFVVGFWAWHVPALYELALRSDFWHHVEHACFFGTALLFWRPVILPWPARSSWPRWAMIPYLALADLQNSALAAILTFSDRVIYASYDAVPRMWGLSALEDQAIAGVIMWVPGSLLFLLPVVWLVATALAVPVGATDGTCVASASHGGPEPSTSRPEVSGSPRVLHPAQRHAVGEIR